MERPQDYVLRTVEERGIRFIQLWFTDVLGTPKAFSITPAELETALAEGMTFDGSAIDGFTRVHESDMLAIPDAKTFQILPFEDDVARVFCDIRDLDGEPFEGDPRHVLRRALDRARERGMSFYVAPEVEWFTFRSADVTGAPEPIDQGSYFDLGATGLGEEVRRRTVLVLEEMGIPVEYSQHEDGPGQHEIDLRHTDALSMADTVVTARLVVKRVAEDHGVHATFMPKPLEGVQGSGMHTHVSLFEGDVNAFHDPGDPYGLSKVAKGFIAGLLRHAREITAVTNQWVNSYKRLVLGYEAPVAVGWARNNRSALVRVPVHKVGKADSARVEYRAPDPACNPYLTFALLLAAGLRGVEEGYELPDEAAADLFALTADERAAAGLEVLPGSLGEAVDLLERSDLVAEALGSHVHEWFVRNKRAEWAAYRTKVTPFELDRYLRAL